MSLHRYWLTFELSSTEVHPVGVHLGCGITARDLEDALQLARARVWQGGDLPALARVQEEVDISTLDSKRIRPNMGDVTRRGVWYPLGYTS
jgi:hypothetical protein